MSDYQCPFCKKGATEIKETTSLPSVVIRKRRCLFCGKSHHTTERAENIGGGLQLLLDAACEVIRKNKMKSDGSDR